MKTVIGKHLLAYFLSGKLILKAKKQGQNKFGNHSQILNLALILKFLISKDFRIFRRKKYLQRGRWETKNTIPSSLIRGE